MPTERYEVPVLWDELFFPSHVGHADVSREQSCLVIPLCTSRGASVSKYPEGLWNMKRWMDQIGDKLYL